MTDFSLYYICPGFLYRIHLSMPLRIVSFVLIPAI